MGKICLSSPLMLPCLWAESGVMSSKENYLLSLSMFPSRNRKIFLYLLLLPCVFQLRGFDLSSQHTTAVSSSLALTLLHPYCKDCCGFMEPPAHARLSTPVGNPQPPSPSQPLAELSCIRRFLKLGPGYHWKVFVLSTTSNSTE